LERLRKVYVKSDLSEEEYDRYCRRIAQEQEKLLKQLPEATASARQLLDDFSKILEWANNEERKRIIHLLVRAVYVDERIVKIEPRKAFAVLFEEQVKRGKK
jgi:hypothetical protein